MHCFPSMIQRAPRLRLTRDEMLAHGLPEFSLSCETDGFLVERFPEMGTLASLRGPNEGLPCLLLGWASERVRDASHLAAYLDAREGGGLSVLALGEPGWLEIAGASRAARTFHALWEPTGARIAACAAAIPLEIEGVDERPTLLVVAGVAGSVRALGTPEAVASEPRVARILASLRVDTADPSRFETRRLAAPLSPLPAGE